MKMSTCNYITWIQLWCNVFVLKHAGASCKLQSEYIHNMNTFLSIVKQPLTSAKHIRNKIQLIQHFGSRSNILKPYPQEHSIQLPILKEVGLPRSKNVL